MSTNVTDYSTFLPATSEIPISKPACRVLIDARLSSTRVRVWDLLILIPNLLFFFFLLWKLKTVIDKLSRTNSPIFATFYIMVFLVAVLGVLRSVVSMTVNAATTSGDVADKLLWLILRFFLIAIELSVIIFGVAFGHLDSRKSIQRVLLVTGLISLVYSITQGTLEFTKPNEHFTFREIYDIFGHGGMPFFFVSSFIFFIIYTTITILPFTGCRQRWSLPAKKSFYYYCATLAFINVLQAVGSALLFFHNIKGMCVINASTLTYFTCFAPMMYFTFMREFFSSSQSLSSLLFSYKAHIDEEAAADDDSLSLPQQYPSNPRLDSINAYLDNTNLDQTSSIDSSQTSVNPMYNPTKSSILKPMNALKNPVA